MERFVCERVRGPRCVELVEATRTPLDAREVDAVEAAERLARLRREVRVVRRVPLSVELDTPCFSVHVDEACEKARAANGDLPTGEVAGDRRQLILLADALFMARETKRRKGAGDDEQDCDRPHLQRIGRPSDGLDSNLARPTSAAGDRAHYPDLRVTRQRFIEERPAARVDSIYEHVDQPAELASLVEQEIRDR